MVREAACACVTEHVRASRELIPSNSGANRNGYSELRHFSQSRLVQPLIALPFRSPNMRSTAVPRPMYGKLSTCSV